MIAGHFGLAAATRALAPRVPLGALMLASVWLDVIFVPLLLGGVETLAPLPGTKGGYGDVLIHADYTHSLAGAVAIAALTGALAALRWGRRGGAVVGAVVFSHWLLDLPVHHHDMPLLPPGVGSAVRVGFGLWSQPHLVAAIELALVVLGAVVYFRAAARLAPRAARAAASAILATGVLTLAANVAGL